MKDVLDDIKHYDPNPNVEAAEKIAHNLRLVMHDADARFVSVTDPEEMERVKKNFAIRKLQVTEEQAEEAVQAVAKQMKDCHNKSRITFYYLVAKHLNKFAHV